MSSTGNRIPGRGFQLALLLAGVAALAACAVASPARDRQGHADPKGGVRNAPPEPPEIHRSGDRDDDDEEQEELSVTGRLDLGGSCPAIHTPNGDSWDLTGDLGEHHDGDRVRILGFTAGRSACGGRALRIEEVQER